MMSHVRRHASLPAAACFVGCYGVVDMSHCAGFAPISVDAPFGRR